MNSSQAAAPHGAVEAGVGAHQPTLAKSREMMTIEMADGDLIYGDYSFMAVDSMDDWTVAEESEHDDPTEYVIRRWVAVDERRRLFGVPLVDDEDEAAS